MLSSGLLHLLVIGVNDSAGGARTILAFLKLILIETHVLLLKLSHLFDFVEIHNEALLLSVLLLNAFSAEYCLMIRAVEMFDSFLVLTTEFFFEVVIKGLLIKVGGAQYLVSLDDFIQDIDVQWQFLYCFQLFNQLPAYWASHSEVVMEVTQTLSAQSVTTVDHYPGDALSHVVFQAAEIAKVETSRLVVD